MAPADGGGPEADERGGREPRGNREPDSRGSRDPEPAVVFQPLHEDVSVPTRSTELSAGYDVRAYLRGRRIRVVRAAGTGIEEVAADGDPAGAGDRARHRVPGLRLEPGDRALVPTGFRARLPAGYEGQIRIRSSMAWKKGIIVPNAPGTVDADYPEEWFVLVQNASGVPQRIEHGERIAQIVLARHEVLPWREGPVRARTNRTGGLGSTGR